MSFIFAYKNTSTFYRYLTKVSTEEILQKKETNHKKSRPDGRLLALFRTDSGTAAIFLGIFTDAGFVIDDPARIDLGNMLSPTFTISFCIFPVIDNQSNGRNDHCHTSGQKSDYHNCT